MVEVRCVENGRINDGRGSDSRRCRAFAAQTWLNIEDIGDGSQAGKIVGGDLNEQGWRPASIGMQSAKAQASRVDWPKVMINDNGNVGYRYWTADEMGRRGPNRSKRREKMANERM